jgi:N-acetylglutamate synthase-like GNAT family acetyltransferase/2-polyprenyl-3-methyl-5-hydroxy-6-metoxy-1,4-benzoquinol methylase
MSDETREHEAIKAAVRERYARAIAEPAQGCCGDGEVRPRGTLARTAGYDPTELQGVPAGAVESSFGCGNPLALVEVLPGDVVLDLGSGAGLDCLLAASRVGPTGRVIGLDMTPEMIERARAHAREVGVTNVEFRQGEMERMPVGAATVDWIISNCVICLSPDKDAVFREMARVLKPGGQVSVSDVVADALPEALRRDPTLWSACMGGAIPEDDYLARMAAAGLADARVEARLVYERAQIAAFVEAAITRGDLRGDDARALREGVDGFVGHIASARIRAERPVVGPRGERVGIRAAASGDLGAVERLLREAELPPDDAAAHLRNFLVAEAGGVLVGCAGFEAYGPDALFRSLAVTPAYRGRGLARALMRRLTTRARAAGVDRAWGLTFTIPGLLGRWGFVAVDRAAAPSAIRQTGQFAGCCASAPLFVLALGGERSMPTEASPATAGGGCCGGGAAAAPAVVTSLAPPRR